MKFVPKRLEETADISRGKPTLESTLKYLLSVVIILGLGYVLLGLAADGIAASISEEWEVKLFRWSFEEVEKPTAEFERARAIFEKMSADEQLRPLEYRLFLVDFPDANAFAVVIKPSCKFTSDLRAGTRSGEECGNVVDDNHVCPGAERGDVTPCECERDTVIKSHARQIQWFVAGIKKLNKLEIVGRPTRVDR